MAIKREEEETHRGSITVPPAGEPITGTVIEPTRDEEKKRREGNGRPLRNYPRPQA
ncbi:MAG: hypothetical protein ACK4N5_04145 [Myxococcales bacterium]